MQDIKWKDSITSSFSGATINNYVLTVVVQPQYATMHSDVTYTLSKFDNNALIKRETLRVSERDCCNEGMTPLCMGKQEVEAELAIHRILSDDI